jgi:hypothetical protein
VCCLLLRLHLFVVQLLSELTSSTKLNERVVRCVDDGRTLPTACPKTLFNSFQLVEYVNPHSLEIEIHSHGDDNDQNHRNYRPKL